MSLDQRSAARLAIVQALYQMEVAGKGLNEIFAEFESHWIGREIEGVQYKPAELTFFRDVLQGVLTDQVAIDRQIDGALSGGWPLARLEAVMRAALRAVAGAVLVLVVLGALMLRRGLPARELSGSVQA